MRDILVHASCVSVGGRGVLLCGPSGAGKSDLALRLIDAGGVLVSDDQVALRPAEGRVTASAPDALAGLLEVRGLGIVRMPRCDAVSLALVADLDPALAIERMPDPAARTLCGIPVPALTVAARHASAAALIRAALRSLR